MTTAIVILAAGRSRRMGSQNKMLVDLGGTPLFTHSVNAALATDLRPLFLVHEDTALDCPEPVVPVYADKASLGQAHSLSAGIQAAANAKASAAIVMLADMPFVTAEVIHALHDKACEDPDTIWRPRFDGRPGHPVYWPSRFFNDLAALSGDEGARPLLKANQDAIAWLEWADDGVVFDVDTPVALSEAQARLTA